MPISALPTPPSRSDAPQDFSDRADALLGALPGFVTEANALQSDVNAKEASAASHATVATDKAAEAQGYATTASTKASEAAASAEAAAAAANNAEIAFDSFDDKYLGSKASDPTTDNDGNALLTGALYWNTTVGAVRVWNGSSWLSMAADASIVDFQQAGTGASVRTAQDKLREWVSVKDFGAVGDGSNEFDKILAAWQYCLANGKDLYFPAGEYSSGVNNMPFKHTDYPATTLLDCGNITIFGDGPATVLRSDSAVGADVLNLYSVKNLHIRNLSLTASLSGTTGAGSNGCSIVGGFDNVTVDGLWVNDLPYVDKGTYLDGGKAFTIQPGIPATECGTVRATRIYAKGCVFGADVSVDLVNWGGKKHAVDIDIIAEDCFVAMVFSAGAATGALSEGMTSGIRARVHGINCQYDAQIVRAHGIELDMMVTTNKSAAARRLNPQGGAWHSADAIVTALDCRYAKNSQIRVVGDKGDCDYGVRIGGTAAGSSGLNGATEHCDIFLDIGNHSSVADFDLADSGGNTIFNSRLQISTATAATLPVELYSAGNNNNVVHGARERLVGPVIQGPLKFAYTDGITSYNSLERDSLGLYFMQDGGSSPDIIVNGTKDHLGNLKFGVRNDGYVVTAGRGGASAVALLTGVLPIYTEANVLWGYVPVYASYTPA